MISYLQAVVLGALQGVTELFPVSSLGHSVLVPALIGGSWADLVTQSSGTSTTPYLAFVVALHVASALALVVFLRAEWVRIVRGLCRSVGPSVRSRRVVTRDADEHLAWLLVVATIPVGLIGLALEHPLRTLFARPVAAAVFLTLNGVVLLVGEHLRRRAPVPVGVPAGTPTAAPARELSSLRFTEAVVVGGFQSLALLAGISRSGITMVGGLARGLSHRDAARFAFLLATPVILGAGLVKLPELATPAAAGIHGQVVVGALVAAAASYASARWLTRWFETRTLTPFAVYSVVAGLGCLAWFALAG